jgi:folate-dependent phosphoribosylglycinamide formyltransferase PurN
MRTFEVEKGWVACLSQTGGELFDIVRSLSKVPETILIAPSNKVLDEALIFFKKYSNLHILQQRPTLHQYVDLFERAKLITLHGFLYILPKEIFTAYSDVITDRIYNGHPGAIHKYPELKGFNPQEKAYGKYDVYGTIIHRVIQDVDEGEILKAIEIPASNISSLDDLYDKLKEASLQLWIDFLRGII